MALPPDPDTFVPSTPMPTTATLVKNVLSSALMILGALGVPVGSYSDSTLMIVASALVTAAGAAWSLWERFAAARKDHAGSVRSAQIERPVKAT